MSHYHMIMISIIFIYLKLLVVEFEEGHNVCLFIPIDSDGVSYHYY